jgi:hypothetical protein
VIPVLFAITLACVIWSLYTRRITWRCFGETGITLSLALQGTGLFLMTPAAAEVGRFLHALTGEWNLEDYAGHVCILAAVSAMAYHVCWRVDTEIARNFKIAVEIPGTVTAAVMFALLVIGNGGHVCRPYFFDIPFDLPLRLYWTLFSMMMIWIMLYAGRAMAVLRLCHRSRPVANIYLLASATGILAAMLAIATVLSPLNHLLGTNVFLACAPTVLVALGAGYSVLVAFGAGYSWMRKTRWFTDR